MKYNSFQLIKIISKLLKGPECLEKCPVCETGKEHIQIQTNQPTVINDSSKNIGDNCDINNERILHDDHAENSKNNTFENTNSSHYIKTINGKFFMVNGANISCKCPRSPNGISKFAHTCDGYIDLVLIRKTSFLNNLRFLLAMSSRNCKIVSPNTVLLTL